MIRDRHIWQGDRPRHLAPFLVAVLAASLVAACSGPTTSDDSSGGASSTALQEALELIPSDTSYLTVTDWATIKAAAGHKNATSASTNAERHSTYTDIYAHQATGSKFANDTISFDLGTTIGSPPPEGLSNQAKLWGFDALDLRWDASVYEPADHDGVMLLRLRQGIDLDELNARFDQRGFTNEQFAGVTLRTLGGAIYSTKMPDTETAMSNTAFLPDGKTIAISTSTDELRNYLLARNSGAPPDAKEVATQLDSPWAMAMLAGTPACGYFNPPAGWNLDALFAAAVQRQIQAVGPLATFSAVAVGYSGTHSPSSRITFVYTNTTDPANDKAGRYTLAQQAYRLADRNTYASTVFTVSGATVSGRSLNLNVTPVNSTPIQLFSAFASRDLVPAVCGA